MAETQPFRFMDLAMELRLMVYERLPQQITHTRIDSPRNRLESKPMLMLMTRTCSVALLRVSRTINKESKVIVSKRVKEWILCHPVRTISSEYTAVDTWKEVMLFVLGEKT